MALPKWVAKPILWFMETSAWKYVSQKWISSFTARISGYPSFPMSDYHKLTDIIRPDQNTIYTFASTDSMSLASILIRYVVGEGKFSHAGLILAEKGKPLEALHMIGEGLARWDLLKLLREIDYLAVNKIVLNDEQYAVAKSRIEFLMSKPDLKYDFAQRMNNGKDKFYCSEANYFVLDGLSDDPDLEPEILYGIPTFSPDKVSEVGELIYSNHPEFKKG